MKKSPEIKHGEAQFGKIRMNIAHTFSSLADNHQTLAHDPSALADRWLSKAETFQTVANSAPFAEVEEFGRLFSSPELVENSKDLKVDLNRYAEVLRDAARTVRTPVDQREPLTDGGKVPTDADARRHVRAEMDDVELAFAHFNESFGVAHRTAMAMTNPSQQAIREAGTVGRDAGVSLS